MKGYRKLRIGERIKEGDVNEYGIYAWSSVGEKNCPSYQFYRPIQKPEKHSYVAKVVYFRGAWHWGISGANGKPVLNGWNEFGYEKKSYAIRQAKSFCSKVKGVKFVENKGE